MPRKPRIPSYRLHKPSGQAVVTLTGKDHYLGRFGSPESESEYWRLLTEWRANHRLAPGPASPALTTNELLLAYVRFAEGYYRKNGRPTGQLNRIRSALRPVRRLYGHTPARDFGPLALKAVRQAMIDAGWSRNFTNACVGCVKRVWKWAGSEELVPPETYHRLQTVEGLRRGRSAAKETARIRPVEWARVKPVLPHVSRPVRAMIKLQLLTGMRPGEVIIMRVCDIDRKARIWRYRPSVYKTEHIERGRVVYLGPRAQRVLKKFFRRPPGAYLFSPKEGKRKRTRRVGDHYSVYTYHQAIGYGCAKAGVEAFTPLQLRKTAATRIRKRYGIELARIILGHSTAFTTEIYAEADRRKAVEAMDRIG